MVVSGASSAPAAGGKSARTVRHTRMAGGAVPVGNLAAAGAGLCDLFRRFGGRSIVVVMSVMGDAVGLCCRHARIAAECTVTARADWSGPNEHQQARNRFIVRKMAFTLEL